MWHHLRGSKQGFQQYNIYCQKALLQQQKLIDKNKNFLTFAAKFNGS